MGSPSGNQNRTLRLVWSQNRLLDVGPRTPVPNRGRPPSLAGTVETDGCLDNEQANSDWLVPPREGLEVAQMRSSKRGSY